MSFRSLFHTLKSPPFRMEGGLRLSKTLIGRHRPRTALCGPPRRMSAAKPCATLVLGYALHGFQPFLALVGLRPPLVAGFGLR